MDNQTIEKPKSNNSEIFSALEELMKETVIGDLKWYEDSSIRHLWAHRITGVLVIILSASLPLFALLEFSKLVVSSISVTIAIITGLKSFYRFNEVYIANMRGMVELKNYVSDWKLAMIQAKHQQNIEEGLRIAIEATATLLLKRDMVDRKNTKDYVQFYTITDKKD